MQLSGEVIKGSFTTASADDILYVPQLVVKMLKAMHV